MNDGTVFFSAHIEKFHFDRLVVEMSLDMVFDVGTSACNAVIRSHYAVDPFRVHIIPLQMDSADNLCHASGFSI